MQSKHLVTQKILERMREKGINIKCLSQKTHIKQGYLVNLIDNFEKCTAQELFSIIEALEISNPINFFWSQG